MNGYTVRQLRFGVAIFTPNGLPIGREISRRQVTVEVGQLANYQTVRYIVKLWYRQGQVVEWTLILPAFDGDTYQLLVDGRKVDLQGFPHQPREIFESVYGASITRYVERLARHSTGATWLSAATICFTRQLDRLFA